MQQSSTYRMRLAERVCLSDPACDELIIKIALKPEHTLQTFIPGQYVRMGIPQVKDPAPAYFAVASAPSDTDHYEFVIKATSGFAKHLTAMEIGSELEVEGPMGKGFDLSPYQGYNIILIGVGTGIAPLRSVWRELIQQRQDFASIAIYAGFLTAFHRLLTDEMGELAEHDIDVSISLTTGHEDWNGPVGYVQHALADDEPNNKKTVVCLAGMSAMLDACTETLHNLGFNDDHILLNF